MSKFPPILMEFLIERGQRYENVTTYTDFAQYPTHVSLQPSAMPSTMSLSAVRNHRYKSAKNDTFDELSQVSQKRCNPKFHSITNVLDTTSLAASGWLQYVNV